MNKGCAVLFILPFILVGIGTLYLTYNEYQEYVELRDSGVETRGRFVDKRISTSTDDDGDVSYSYYVIFYFNIGEQGYDIEEQVDEQFYDRADNGEPLKVIYAPDNPRNATIEPVGLGDTMAIGIFAAVWNGIMCIVGMVFAGALGLIKLPFFAPAPKPVTTRLN